MINSHILPLWSIPSGSLQFMLCACIRLLPEPHSMPDSYMRLPSSSRLPTGYLLIYRFFCVVKSGTCPNCTVYPVVFYTTVHVLASGTFPKGPYILGVPCKGGGGSIDFKMFWDEGGGGEGGSLKF